MDDTRGDRISKLPNDLLVHGILSLLDMKQVVQTSILSSRWRYLWISMPSLNFNQKVFHSDKQLRSSCNRFVKFVDMVLQSKTSIETFVLSCVSDDDELFGNEQVCRWIVDAVRLKVSVLELQIDNGFSKKPLTLPLCLCKSLTTLKIDLGLGLSKLNVLSLPDSVCLTGLKTLHLSTLVLIGEESTDTFFSRCPVLETLIIFNCIFKYVYKSNYLPSSILTCETLVSLELLDMPLGCPIFSNVPDSVNLPSLECLHLKDLKLFSGESTANLFFSSCSSLESLILNACVLHENSDELPRCVFMCKTLVKLSVVSYSLSAVFHIPDLCSLPCLKAFHLNSFRFLGGWITENFFLSFPVLETLIISDCSFTITNNNFPRLRASIVSKCSFTSSHFFCESLTKLVLKTSISGISLPASMSFPALKFLHFESHFLYDKDVITNILTSCPDLESLTIMKCVFHRFNVNIFSHKLRHLTLVKNKSRDCYISNTSSNGYKVKLNAPNLTSFICKESKGYMLNVYTIENLSSIVKVDINFDMEVEEEKEARSTHILCENNQIYAAEIKRKKPLYAQHMMKIMGVLYNVKDLTLSAWFLEVVSGALNLPDSPTIQFCNLRCLKLGTWRTMDCAHAVMYLLERSPNIESLSVKFAEIPLSLPFFEKNPAGKEYWEERLSLNCMLHHLTSVKLEDFSGCYPELKFVEFLLKNAMNLQELMICFVTIKDPKSNAETRVVKVSEEEGIIQIPSSFSSSKEKPAGQDYWQERLSLSCMLHHLTSVKLQDFTGCYFELKLVEFLLKNAVSLQELMICFAEILFPKNYAEEAECRVEKLSEELLSLPRASASVEILIYHPGNFTKRMKKLN